MRMKWKEMNKKEGGLEVKEGGMVSLGTGG